ncbi:CpaF family protein [Lachnoclostridium phytofermentans]|uniref:Type II secretion system protein E n=1 Tax=Lachnoclostridium phytofermentans (strain ATCC 700394 / DSM 18823 / ISDg) TaxID=357809 RepID=A9KQB3_LACP7|nr:CpaF family protein [Lachnoclostridium phytofermentans]ABX40422.1 type II secretion system protein E [Lachnoclostridium phytofermentans ISDg]
MEQRKQELQEQILAGIDMTRELTEEELFDHIDEAIKVRGKEEYISITEKQRLRIEIFNSIRRLDVLQELVEDTSITEIMINGAKEIFVERDGKLMKWEKEFESDRKLEDVIQTIVAGANRIINEASPIVDARLKDGSRVNIVLPPIAIGGPTVTIRKFPKETMTMEKLVTIGSLTEEAAEFLKKLVIAGYNIFVSGGTGSGKTTFLNALSNYVPSEERIITIEDSAELQIRNIPNLVRLEVRNANVEGKNEISIRDLIKSSLRMRPDRIIVGEVRDASSIDMLQALNTGHNGMSTGHSNSPTDMLSRLETMVLLGADIPLLAVRKQIASAIDIVIHLGRLRDKTRKVLEVVEVLECVDGEIEVNPLFLFSEEGETKEGKVLGELKKTDNSLLHVQKLLRAGLSL